MCSKGCTEGKTEKATFAGGCFWCVEADFEKLSGVKEVVSGYAGGTGVNPTYEDYGRKGHIEVAQVTYDPSIITYRELLDYFWRHIDPVDAGGQFCDRGHGYTTAIFYYTDEKKRQAEESKSVLENTNSSLENSAAIATFLHFQGLLIYSFVLAQEQK